MAMPGPRAVPAEAKISIRGLTKQFPVRGEKVVALDHIDLEVTDGEFFVVVGPSGCGKTTFLRILMGLEQQSSGQVEIRHRDPAKPLRSMVFQEQSIFPWMTVRDNVGYGLDMRRTEPRTRDRLVDEWLERVGLSRFARAYPGQLSGGMKQRVSLARAFANDPEVLLMDEPFSALDEQNKTILQQELLRIWEDTRKTVVFITHSVDEALTLGDRIMVMTASPGRVKTLIPVPFTRPRSVIDIRADHRYGHLVQEVWRHLQEEVQAARQRGGAAS